MLLELVNNYKIRYEEEIDKVKKEQEFNQQLHTYIELFKNKDKFKNLDIDDFINFLQEIKYTNYPLDNVKTTLIYIKRNNSFDDISCQVFFKNLIQELTYNEKTNKENKNLEKKILEINKLLDNKVDKGFLYQETIYRVKK